MTTLELKKEIHKKIDALTHVGELEDINQSLNWFLSDNLTLEENHILSRLIQASNEAQENKGIPHSQVMKEARTWLRK